MNLNELIKELKFKTSRSSGAGGQHVNKVSSKVELIFDVENSQHLSAEEKQLVFAKLTNRIDNEKLLHLQCDETRSQLKNKELVIERFSKLLHKVFTPIKKRKPTKPNKASVKKRLDNKSKHADKKKTRQFKPE